MVDLTLNIVECTIPPDMTVEQWRRLRRGSAVTQGNRWSLLIDGTVRPIHGSDETIVSRG
jgi:hypothetical protein